MAWNILHGANDIPNGQENAIAIIKEINPDVILMVETYGSGKRIADTLGYNFHLIAPEGTALNDKGTNLSIFSKFPFGNRIDTKYPFYLGGIEIIINNQKIRFFSNWFHYLPWNNAPEKMNKTVEELLEWEQTETRYTMLKNVLPYLEKYSSETDSVPMIFGGDMNSPSHLDWEKNTKTIHNNLVVPWQTTTELDKLGLIDTYRTLNPNPISHPGITWDSEGKDDSHRIDYIFYKGSKLKAIKSKTYNAFFNKAITINDKEIIYPSDHGFVVTSFQLLK
ncbi:endonuclease/exonuclease/phosphatase family protein [Sabulilitoribacter arenilitoris]|uniref:Endonuclease/exonuclease/phosphatase family protein n=2 Tax=Wocania arenilitoris TaxID=2044858 RepID=A0AAE3EN40_9FLAO|nr:endonuclease/exonuclease/phosphatase family protein [Wocania arenilitoris]